MFAFLSFEEVIDQQRLQPFLDRLLIPPEINTALHQGASVAIGVSGGKDSSALLITLSSLLRTRYPEAEMVALHADTGMEWRQTEPHLRDITNRLGIALHIVRREQGDLIQRIQQRYDYLQSVGKTSTPMWPDARNRFCTSEVKVAPLDSWSRQWRVSGTVIHAVGIRAEESNSRAKKTACVPRPKITTKTRTGLTWHPILNFSLREVWQVLGVELHQLNALQQQVRGFLQAGQGDVFSYIHDAGFLWHLSYPLGSTRLSCGCCVLASRNDLRVGAIHNPDLYRRLVQMEIDTGFSFQHSQWLGDVMPSLLPPEMRSALEAVKARKNQRHQPSTTLHLQPLQQLTLF
ncbi:MAG: phosphoadenosine phosphosulfate reductase family protein [Coleofasciculus sp. S288]|nr:phosphoadenosine phosphosulfate reductase family protein [Coleofasciculus sp. S288]